jgi:hypothetical protein
VRAIPRSRRRILQLAAVRHQTFYSARRRQVYCRARRVSGRGPIVSSPVRFLPPRGLEYGSTPLGRTHTSSRRDRAQHLCPRRTEQKQSNWDVDRPCRSSEEAGARAGGPLSYSCRILDAGCASKLRCTGPQRLLRVSLTIDWAHGVREARAGPRRAERWHDAAQGMVPFWGAGACRRRGTWLRDLLNRCLLSQIVTVRGRCRRA